jgi:polysaccharide biosynthesis protein PslG
MSLSNVGFNQVELPVYGEPSYPPAADLPTVIAGMVDIGATWIRIGAFWELIEATFGSYDWTGLDAALIAATNAGLTPLLCATNIPSWTPTPVFFAAFCTAIAQRYGPGTSVLSAPLKHYEIWNEPNSFFSAPPGGVSPAAMYAYQQAAYDAIKTVDSGSTVITAGLLPVQTLLFGAAMDAVTWLTGMYAAGPPGGPYPWDGVGFHDYSGTSDAGAQEPTATQVWIAEIPALYQVTVANGFPVPIWLTEFGFETQPSGQAAGVFVTPAIQAQWLVEQITNVTKLAAQQGVPLGPQFIYNYRDSLSDDSGNDGMGVVEYNFNPRPSWAALQALISGGAAIGATSGSVTITLGEHTTASGTGPTGVTVGGVTESVAVSARAGGTTVGGPVQALWAGLGCSLNPVSAPMNSVQQLMDDVAGFAGATVDDFVSALNTVEKTAASAAQTAETAGSDLITIFTGVVGDFEAIATDLVDALTGTNVNGVTNTNAIAAIQSSLTTGMAGISYSFGSATPLTTDYPGTTNPAWTIPTGFPSPTFGGSNYVVNANNTPAPMVFTGNPENAVPVGGQQDHGLITDKNQVFITLGTTYQTWGIAVLWMSGHGTTTLAQNVELVVTIVNDYLTMQINTATGPYTGLSAHGSLYLLPTYPQAGDVIGLQYDNAGHYTMVYNASAVGLASGQTYSWDASGAGLTHGVGYRESGLVLLDNGGGGSTIGLGGTFNAIDYTGAGF